MKYQLRVDKQKGEVEQGITEVRRHACVRNRGGGRSQ